MPIPCIACSAALPENAAFCPRCGRATGASLVVKESPESLLRQLASMLQKHSGRKLIVKFISPWGFENRSPTKKVSSIRFHTGLGLLDSSRAFGVGPHKGKTLFADSSWADITVEVFQEAGFEDARAFGEAYRAHMRRNVEIVKKYT
jgi:hypothetical protein